MTLEQIVKGITVFVLVVAALETARAEDAANEPAVEVRAAIAAAPAAEAKNPLLVSDVSASPARTVAAAAAPEAGRAEPPAPTETAAATPGLLERTMSGLSGWYERAKTFVTDIVK